MTSENIISRRLVLRALGFGAAGLAVGLPLLHARNALRAIDAVFGGKIDCANDAESQNPNYPVDAIIVPGAGTVRTDDGTYVPSEYGKIRLEAAAIAYLNKLAPTIILLGQEPNSGENGSTERTYLQDAFSKLSGNTAVIPDEAILVEDHSVNTATNMSELPKIDATHNIIKVIIITNDFHEARAMLFACNNGVSASPLSAESILVAQDSRQADAIRKMKDSWATRSLGAKEKIELTLAIWDSKGMVPTFLRKITK